MSIFWVDGGCRPNGKCAVCGEKVPPGLKEGFLYSESHPGHTYIADTTSYGSYARQEKAEEAPVVETFQLPMASTNNEAEYWALITLLRKGIATKQDWIMCDSALVVGQLTEGWKVNALNLRRLYREAADLLAKSGARLGKVDRSVIEGVLGH